MLLLGFGLIKVKIDLFWYLSENEVIFVALFYVQKEWCG